MEFILTGTSQLRTEINPANGKAKLLSSSILLEVSKNLDKSKYMDDDNIPTADGAKALTQVFVQGLVANIHQAHQKGLIDSAEHLRYIISELERGFMAHVDVVPGQIIDTNTNTQNG